MSYHRCKFFVLTESLSTQKIFARKHFYWLLKVTEVEYFFRVNTYRYINCTTVQHNQRLPGTNVSRVSTVGESQEKSEFWGSQGKSGKTERVREKSGNFKIPLTGPIIYALFSQLSSASGGFAPRPPPGLRPKHCRLVYIAIFYNGTKFSITFVYLVLFYWCHE